ncbi:Fe(3+) dicitrate ABC transporter ATP-binding protein FecE [Pontibacterium granulatum]|uniref:Fe(3+) dicitrate ABC transporter ATP-binding protein FecE n=1 Tax=Pontibacterium granulatum TaxID=2036029 RepID=UPI00249A4AA3|nr:Fe(3+) dicitrate ABC transporter ATP-binding protein FecE [Pontibacterium granulatum]MDI3324537.1 Fe(3+) dicitrate ABC transporter ATP-binding protein FecE [Pontibacterium granulatum]
MSYLSIEGLRLSYGKQIVIDNLDLEIRAGKITALIGPNGCGKSTLLKTIARVLTPERGTVRLRGEDIHLQNSRTVSQHLALLPQSPITPEGISIRDLVSYGRAPWCGRWGRLSGEDEQIVSDALEHVGLTELADQPASALSGGQRQRAWIAMILAQQTELVLLDEPTTWLDICHQIELLQMMRQLNQAGKTIVVVLHDLNQACRYCDELVVLKHGQLQRQGSPADIFTSELVSSVFDVTAEIHRDPIAGSPTLVALN